MSAKQQSKEGIRCPSCSGRRIWRKGCVPTRTGQKVRYVCFTCGKTFYAPPKTAKAKKRSR